jgi:hypothetical protein
MATIVETDLELLDWQQLRVVKMHGSAWKQRIRAGQQRDPPSIKSMGSIEICSLVPARPTC